MQKRYKKQRRLTTFVVVLFLLPFLFFHCANPIPPEGGERDETPPQLDTTESTANYQTNFSKQPIELAFDEWVELKDPYNEIVISPPLERSEYEVSIKRRSVIFEFTESAELRDSATYTINFGEAIQDLTEGNAADYLRFVFATGDQLDSLQMNGLIVDARSGEPVEEALFMLYDELADSVVYDGKPFYFGKTGENGQFQINNIKEGIFKGFALLDEGRSYIYDGGNEKIGFPDSLITLSESGPAPQVRIRLFQERSEPRMVDNILDEFGTVKILFNQPVEGMEVTTPDGPAIDRNYDRDTLEVWYAEAQSEPWSLIVNLDTIYRDTFRVPAVESEAFLQTARLESSGSSGSSIAPNKDYQLTFNHPLAVIDTSLMTLLEDTSRTSVPPLPVLDTIFPNKLYLQYNLKAGISYELQILPGGLYDIFGIPNQDTVSQNFRVQERKEFGNLDLSITGLDSTENYVIQVTEGEDKVILERLSSGQSSFQERFSLLPPGKYTVRLITDWNGNGRWDTGDYELRRQPEPIYLEAMEQLRANWDLEATVNLIPE